MTAETSMTQAPDGILAALLPCPFCGGDADFFENEIDFVPWPYVMCHDCNAELPAVEGQDKAEIAANWNRRPSAPDVMAAVENLFAGGFIEAGTRENSEWAQELVRRIAPLKSALSADRTKADNEPGAGVVTTNRAMVAEIPFDPTNHHNALKCPYCNPKGLVLSAPTATPSADTNLQKMQIAPVAGRTTGEPVAWRMRLPDGGVTSWFDGKPPTSGNYYELAFSAPHLLIKESGREALDNSQSLLVMIGHLGAARGITTSDWDSEDLTKLIDEQIKENRAILSLSPTATPPAEQSLLELEAAFLVSLTENNCPPDITEFLSRGDPMRGVPPRLIQKAIKALCLPKPPAGQWQDIATAPKDRLIDLWTVGWGAEPHRVADCYYDRICGEWRTSRPAGQLLCIKERYVTHWQPLPNPPSGSISVEGAETTVARTERGGAA